MNIKYYAIIFYSNSNLIKDFIEMRKKKKETKPHPFFATITSDSPKMAIDFFTISHILIGQVIFFVLYFCLSFLFLQDIGNLIIIGFWTFLLTVIIAVTWIPIENIMYWRIGYKFENIRDSVLNSVFDAIFIILGGLLTFLINHYWISLILIIIEIIIFFFLRWKFVV